MDSVAQVYFNNAEEAFEYYYDFIMNNGVEYNNTKAVFNIMIKIKNPIDRNINTKWRKFNKKYADIEWNWYNSKNKNPDMVVNGGAKLWNTLRDKNGEVMSNYGYWWNLNNQLEDVIETLRTMPTTRQAVISLLDTKIMDTNKKDVICTWGINFYILNNKLNMSIMMRSNDLIYGFCNDQYCFSKLQEYVSNSLNIEIGEYTHIVNNMHIYEKHFNMKNKIKV